MRGHRTAWVLSCALFISTSALAEDKAAPEQVANCISNLGNKRFSVREQAARELYRIGQPALKPLREALVSQDEEVRQRADSLIKAIDARLLNEELIRAPKLHLKYDKVPLQDAIADLSKKTGLPLILDPKSNKSPRELIALDTGEMPFWEAVEKFLAVTGLVESPAATPNVVVDHKGISGLHKIRGGRMLGEPWAYPTQSPSTTDNFVRLIESKGSFSASTGSIIRVKGLPKETPGSISTKGSNEFTLVLDVTPAPSMAWQGLVNVDIRRAIDERGVSLAQSHLHTGDESLADATWGNLQGQIMFQGRGQIFIQNQVMWSGDVAAIDASPINPRHVPITLVGKDASSKSLKELEGVVTAQVLTPPQALLTVENVLTASMKETISSGQYRLRITERTDPKSTFGFTMRFRLETPAQNDVRNFPVRFGGRLQQFIQIDNGASMNGQPQIAFFDASGKEIKNASHTPSLTLSLMEQSFDGTNSTWVYHVSLHRDQKTDEPVKMVLTGRKSVCVEVPFSLKNVPLP